MYGENKKEVRCAKSLSFIERGCCFFAALGVTLIELSKEECKSGFLVKVT